MSSMNARCGSAKLCMVITKYLQNWDSEPPQLSSSPVIYVTKALGILPEEPGDTMHMFLYPFTGTIQPE